MFYYIYQAAIIVFVLQGALTPALVILAGILWWKQSKRLAALSLDVKTASKASGRSGDRFDAILEGLPKLKPLNCGNCGAATLLEETETVCPNCKTHGPLPDDYADASSLRTHLKDLVKSAVRNWRAANVLTHPTVAWSFFLLTFVEPLVIFPAVVIGSSVFPHTPIDKAFERIGENASFLIILSSFFGFIIWMVAFIFLASLSKSLRKKLPARPVIDPRKVESRETAQCQACGGAIEYGSGDFACICTYCSVENFRVRFVRRERAASEKQSTSTKSVLFGATEILDEFVGNFFFTMVLLIGASVILSLSIAIGNMF